MLGIQYVLHFSCIIHKNNYSHTLLKYPNVPGYPEFVRDIKQLDERYEQLEVRSDAYFVNNLNINLYNLKKNLEKINEPVNKTTWSKCIFFSVKTEQVREVCIVFQVWRLRR